MIQKGMISIEEARVKLVKRAISGEEEEDLSWDLDDEGDGTEAEKDRKVSEENVVLEEEKVESREVSSSSSKDSDISVISTQPSLREVEDLGWDQMEDDIRSNEDKSAEETGQCSRGRRGFNLGY
ncbi:hypothetical protein F2Q70_00027125 [Brassica cretica]|uniref:Uncharacterized protein n=1 Tax=Brassica cretica TaxID=69181 RepID=A0A8S9L2G8_BRACR|nr:hypothetical protein F2Q70_00027125 [Brassica cretica]